MFDRNLFYGLPEPHLVISELCIGPRSTCLSPGQLLLSFPKVKVKVKLRPHKRRKTIVMSQYKLLVQVVLGIRCSHVRNCVKYILISFGRDFTFRIIRYVYIVL